MEEEESEEEVEESEEEEEDESEDEESEVEEKERLVDFGLESVCMYIDAFVITEANESIHHKETSLKMNNFCTLCQAAPGRLL